MVQCFAVSLGGFKTGPMVLPEKRQAALDAIRSPGGRSGAITQRELKRTALSSVHHSTSRAGQQRVAVQTLHVPGGEELTHRQLVDTKVRVAQRESCAAEAAATAAARGIQPEHLSASAHPNDPPPVYSMLGCSTHPLEIKGKQLVNGTDSPLWDVAPPPPVRPHGQPSAPAADATSVFNYITTRVNTNDSLDSHFMAWATRMIQRYLSGGITGGPHPGASLASGFDWAMHIALTRGHRTLAVRASRYVPSAKLAAAASRASGHRTPMGRPLVVMYPPQPRHDGPARVKFGVVDGSFEGFDTGSELELNGVHHDDQCVFITQSALDLVSDGADLSWDVVHARSSAAAKAFHCQALAVRAEVGLPSSRMTVTEAKWRQDIDDVIEMSDHDGRCAVWLGRDLPPHLAFSARPWALVCLVIIISRGVGSPARIFVINGESWDSGVDGAWTAFQMLYCLHSMPIRPATPRWRGNRGGDLFLAEAARAGVAPTQMEARSWDHLLARAGKAGPGDVLLPTDVLLKAMRDGVEASWARAGREAIRLPRHLTPRRARSAAGGTAESSTPANSPTPAEVAPDSSISSGPWPSSGPEHDCTPTPAPAPAPAPTHPPFGVPFRVPGPPVVCYCGRPAQMQWNRRYQLCCEPCAYNDGHSQQCDASFGIGIEPEPDDTPTPTPAPAPAPTLPPDASASGGEPCQAAAPSCSVPGCCRLPRLAGALYGYVTGAICCYECVNGDGHSEECGTAFESEQPTQHQQHPPPTSDVDPPPDDLDVDDASAPRAGATLDSVMSSGRWTSSEPGRYCTRGGRVDVLRARQAIQRTIPEVLERWLRRWVRGGRGGLPARPPFGGGPGCSLDRAEELAPLSAEGWFEPESVGAMVTDGTMPIRSGQSQTRCVAEAVMHGPVSRGALDDSPGAARYRGITFDQVLSAQLSDEEVRDATCLVALAETVLDDKAVLSGGEATQSFLELVARTASLSDQMIARADNDYRRVRLAQLQIWYRTHERAVDPIRLERRQGLVNEDLVAYIAELSDCSVSIRTDAPPPVDRTNVRAHSSLEEHETEALLRVWGDFARGGALICSSESGAALEDVQYAPMGRTTKTDDEWFVTDEGRFIYDGSDGGLASVNGKTPVGRHPPAPLPCHIELIIYIVWLAVMSPGIPILLAIRDVKAAFKLVSYSLSDCSWFGTRLPCKLMAASVAFAAGWTCQLVVFGVMQFGWAESPGNYCVHGAAISQAHRLSAHQTSSTDSTSRSFL